MGKSDDDYSAEETARRRDEVIRRMATAELCIRLVDVINLPVASDFMSRYGF